MVFTPDVKTGETQDFKTTLAHMTMNTRMCIGASNDRMRFNPATQELAIQVSHSKGGIRRYLSVQLFNDEYTVRSYKINCRPSSKKFTDVTEVETKTGIYAENLSEVCYQMTLEMER